MTNNLHVLVTAHSYRWSAARNEIQDTCRTRRFRERGSEASVRHPSIYVQSRKVNSARPCCRHDLLCRRGIITVGDVVLDGEKRRCLAGSQSTAAPEARARQRIVPFQSQFLCLSCTLHVSYFKYIHINWFLSPICGGERRRQHGLLSTMNYFGCILYNKTYKKLVPHDFKSHRRSRSSHSATD